jgi:hypothetical protein
MTTLTITRLAGGTSTHRTRCLLPKRWLRSDALRAPEVRHVWLARMSPPGRLCCKSRFASLITKFLSHRRVFHVRMWGVGIDIGKNTYHLISLDKMGAIVLRQKLSRSQVDTRLANMPPCLIGMEACVGAHHLSRKLKRLGHDARLMPAKYVRPYSKGQKNDFRDAEAIAEAVQRPTMKFVATKTVDQLDLQALHRVRERLVSQRTGIINQIRAFLLERGRCSSARITVFAR